MTIIYINIELECLKNKIDMFVNIIIIYRTIYIYIYIMLLDQGTLSYT